MLWKCKPTNTFYASKALIKQCYNCTFYRKKKCNKHANFTSPKGTCGDFTYKKVKK